MSALGKYLWIQFKLDLRERGTLMTYYLVPLIFYLFMSSVFSSINPLAKQTLAATMVIFAVTMGAVLGMPAPLVKVRETGVLRAYSVNGIPRWAVLLTQAVSAFLHLLVVSLLIFLTAPLFFGAEYPVNVPAYFGSLLILLFASIALGLVIGVVAKSQSVAVMLAQAIFLPTVILSGIMFPTSMLPEPLRLLGRLLPGTYIMQAFSGAAFRLPADFNAAIAMAIPAGIGVLAIILTVFKFRTVE